MEIFPKKVIEGFVYLVVAELRLSCASANPASDVLIGICFLGKQMTVKNLFSSVSYTHLTLPTKRLV